MISLSQLVAGKKNVTGSVVTIEIEYIYLYILFFLWL